MFPATLGNAVHLQEATQKSSELWSQTHSDLLLLTRTCLLTDLPFSPHRLPLSALLTSEVSTHTPVFLFGQVFLLATYSLL